MRKTVRERFSSALRWVIESKGVRQGDLNITCSISPASVTDYKYGRREGDEDTREKIAEALGYDYREFLSLGQWILEGNDGSDWKPGRLPPMNMNGEMIRMARVGLKMSQRALGDLLGVTQQAISEWEKGGKIDERHWPLLKQHLGLDIRPDKKIAATERQDDGVSIQPATASPPTDAFGAVLSALFEQITEWLSEEGRDSGAALDFVVEFQDRFEEFRVWKKKRKQSGEVGTLPPVQDRKVANGNR